MHRDCNYEHEVRTPSWECTRGAAVQEPSCRAGSGSEQCPQPGTVGEATDTNEMQMPRSGVRERGGSWGCASSERAFTATSHSNPSGGEKNRGLRVIRLLLLVGKGTRRGEAQSTNQVCDFLHRILVFCSFWGKRLPGTRIPSFLKAAILPILLISCGRQPAV